jgi:3-methylcrotonyl-CoA carboxylase alpha subunit
MSDTFVQGNEIHMFREGAHRTFEWINPYLPESEHADMHGGLRATMPGRVLAVHVQAGDEVLKGAALVVLEAMKMEQTITAPAAGKIERVLCSPGDQVREGAELLTLVDG